MSDNESKRHPFRFLFKLALFLGVLAGITKFVASKKDEYFGITESEARAKMETKLGPRIGEDKAAEVADQVIPKLKEKGVIKADPVEEASTPQSWLRSLPRACPASTGSRRRFAFRAKPAMRGSRASTSRLCADLLLAIELSPQPTIATAIPHST